MDSPQQRYWEKNREKVLAQQRVRYKQEHEHCRKVKNGWVKNNYEKHQAHQRKYRKKYNKTALATYKSLQRRKTVECSEEVFIKWFDAEIKKCCYCDRLLERGNNGDCLSIDRKDNLKGYGIGNMVLACRSCNIIKSDKFTAGEMREIAQKYLKPKWEIHG